MSNPEEKLVPLVPRLVPADKLGIAARVGEEILEHRLSPAAWAKALAAARGNGGDAAGEYARIRIAELSAERSQRLAKAESLEQRRLDRFKQGCGGSIRTVKELLNHCAKVSPLPNKKRGLVSMIWLFSLMLGTAGSIGCAVRLLKGAGAPAWTPMLALGCGMVIAITALLLRFGLPHRWVRAGGYHFALSGATMLVCLFSVLLGTKLMVSAPQQWRLAPMGAFSIPVRVDTAPAPAVTTSRVERSPTMADATGRFQ